MQFGVSIFHANSISIPEEERKSAWCLCISQVIHIRKKKKEKKVMTEGKKSVVHNADENVNPLYTCTHHRNGKQTDNWATGLFGTDAVGDLITHRATLHYSAPLSFVYKNTEEHCKWRRISRTIWKPRKCWWLRVRRNKTQTLCQGWDVWACGPFVLVSRPLATTRQRNLPLECH